MGNRSDAPSPGFPGLALSANKQGWRMSAEVVKRLESRARQAEDVIGWLKEQIASLQPAAQNAELQKLQEENRLLQKDVDHWMKALVEAEERNGVKQVSIPSQAAAAAVPQTAPSAPPPTPSADTKATPEKKGEKKAKPKQKSASKSEGKPAVGAGDGDVVDIGLLDLRVGRIVSAQKHPDADSLYVEQVDVGEPETRTVVSGLVKFVPVGQMQNRMAVLLCNLKPAKMRGVTSQAMVMCASTPDRVEILDPPAEAQPGDIVTCEGFVRRADAQLNPKKKIFEQVAPDLKTDGERRATYRGVRWQVPEKGDIVSQSLANVQIK
ncbi:aminoacyl tRNA synthase complex-interacting multifunctional protein 1-like [Pollicipes pollicipes]|uniref:aminoacyl tRNA synthase complex-interacting multifunctional protein 1-like n=1 Tax=Pollicipes pollicipes TaxID=41117 RepID=UPI0018849756|nr:aminoacyl tRNA synthase complex-interacting multifunctional protein 1-like [Pollicipes pollicipes]